MLYQHTKQMKENNYEAEKKRLSCVNIFAHKIPPF